MEEWKVYPEFPTYEVSNNGQVRNRKRGNILKPHEDKDGYLGVCLCFEGRKYHRRINRIVAITFIPNPDNLEIADHIDKDRKNNCVSNLRWVDTIGNNRNKISNSKVDICDKDGNILKSFDSISEAAEYYNVPDDKMWQRQQLIRKLEVMLNTLRNKVAVIPIEYFYELLRK